MTTKTYQMPNKLEEVDALVLTLKSVVGGILEPEAGYRFEICLVEALSNIAIHADTHDQDAHIEVALSLASDDVIVDVYDPIGTEPFDVRDHAVDLAMVEQTAESGRGLGLILACADGVSYGPTGDRNRLSLTFHNRDQQGLDE